METLGIEAESSEGGDRIPNRCRSQRLWALDRVQRGHHLDTAERGGSSPSPGALCTPVWSGANEKTPLWTHDETERSRPASGVPAVPTRVLLSCREASGGMARRKVNRRKATAKKPGGARKTKRRKVGPRKKAGGRRIPARKPKDDPQGEGRPYRMIISRLTVEKLGVKLYDRASAVAAELVANSYDADAENVVVRVPLGTQLAPSIPSTDATNYFIEVEDDGHGMTPTEAIDQYLIVGSDRRRHPDQGPHSRDKKRPVMGRKGIGKLAPFGICRKIEVISSGGPKTQQGYLTTHFVMDFDRIVQDTGRHVELDRGDQDRTYRGKSGTTIRLFDFLPKRVPPRDTFHRQLARRFILVQEDFSIRVHDLRGDPDEPEEVAPFVIPTMEGAKFDVADRPVVMDDGGELPVNGWLGLAKEAYRNEEMAGVRIYARGKIVATTRDFEQPAGFTGEFTTRSYLVGEVHAEWLDSDDGEDLIRTDRQGILWDSDHGMALRRWGMEQIREIGAASRAPRRRRVRDLFLQVAQLRNRAEARFRDEAVVRAALELGEQIGAFAQEDELEDKSYVEGLCEIILSVAPHRALIEAFEEFSRAVGVERSIEDMADLFGKTRVAELASYAQIAAERIRAIEQLESIVLSGESDESALQDLVSRAPWLTHPTWTVITQNQTLKTFKTAFEQFWQHQSGKPVTLAISHETRRPDFTLVSADRTLHIVEIKAAGHRFDANDFVRLNNYADAFELFFDQNNELYSEWGNGWVIDLVVDAIGLSGVNQRAYESLVAESKLEQMSWVDFLGRAKKAHEEFLDARDAAESARTEVDGA